MEPTLDEHEDESYETMHQHFLKHLTPFGSPGSTVAAGSVPAGSACSGPRDDDVT